MDTFSYVIGLTTGIAIGVAAGKKQKPWSQLSTTQKRFKITLVILLGFGVFLGLVTWFLYSKP